MLLCGVTAEIFGCRPLDGICAEGPGNVFVPTAVPFGTGNDGPPPSGRCESIPSLRFQFWIIADPGLGPSFTRSNGELLEDLSGSNEPGNFGGVGGGSSGGDTGLVDVLGMGRGGREWMSAEGLEISAVFSALVLATSSAACLSAFCCLKILSTTPNVSTIHTRIIINAPLYPRRLRDLRSVESMVINSRASLTFGASNSKRHKEVATLVRSYIFFKEGKVI
jgi:hypothetical protein